MKNNLFKILSAGTLLLGVLASCTKNLDRTPTNAITADQAYATPAGYKEVLAKAYGAFALTANGGPNVPFGTGDVAGIDPGTSDFIRLYWNMQELTTDDAVCSWTDPGLPDLHNFNFTAGNSMISCLYSRCIYQITVCNDFIKQSTDAAISGRGISGSDAANIRHYRAEARFLRAYQYWVLMDLFGNPPFVDENTPIDAFLPPQIKRADLFNYVESELIAIDTLLVAPKQNEYGRVDQAASWSLLSRLYLNAEVYLGAGKGRYTDAISYASKVINSGYTLHPIYKNLFLGDNDQNNPEVIMSVNYDGVYSQNFGGTTFIINSSISGAMNPPSFGVPNGGWGGNRSTANLPNAFGDYSGATDKRAMFSGTKITIDDIGTFTDGLASVKFSNLTSTGATPASANGVFCSTDFPLFRLAEMYLTYAEAVLRGGTGGNNATALQYFNKVRQRGYGHPDVAGAGDMTSIALSDVLNERQREFYWEATRRTDLIRFGMFTGSTYLWPWKGGVKTGTGISANYNLFPIPSSDLIANPHLIQNPGY
ncbi:RagB/SusD family nutrient uptake outer membrane protein [Chitinophagaceae bacterium LWZ2-11]